MNKKEKEQKLQEYEEKVRELLGNHLWGYRCEFMGDHPVMHVVYYDYKVSIITRAEIQRLCPEVELVRVERLLSKAALLYAIEPLLDDNNIDTEIDGEPLMVKREFDPADGYETEISREETLIGEWAKNKLFDVDLSDVDLRYLDDECEELPTGALCVNLMGEPQTHKGLK